MQGTTTSQCPFEKKGREEGTIIEVALTEKRTERLSAMVAAFVQFHSRPESPAIRFTLPRSAYAACSTLEDLRTVILPYQTEVIVADLDYRLRPLLPYHLREPWAQGFVDAVMSKDIDRVLVASSLMTYINEFNVSMPKDIVEQADWLEEHFRKDMAENGFHNPGFDLEYKESGKEVLRVATIAPSSVTLYVEQEVGDDPVGSRNCFTIVKTPFYPREFWRFSEDVEIVVTRAADFGSLSPDTRRNIRVSANRVHREHGIPIADLEGYGPPLGLWIPPYE